MNIVLKRNTNLDLPGVYVIRNKVSKKFYVGSSTMRILKRIWHHISLLRAGKHKNTHLQNSWNKYKEDAFEIIVVRNCNKIECLEIEQRYIDFFIKRGVLFNINPLASGTPNLSKETIRKRAATMKRKYASGEIISTFKGKSPWNKGLTKENFDYSYLKGKKMSYTEDSLRSRVEKVRDKRFPEIYIYSNTKFVEKYRSAADIEEISWVGKFKEIISNRNGKKSKQSKPYYYLCSGKIMEAARLDKKYKGLTFAFKPLHQEIDVEELSKNGEG